MNTISSEERNRWARQIRNTVEIMHQNDLVWGDVKAQNVLVDCCGDAWIVDFDGGWTEGWVDEEFRESKRGDLQGLENMDRYLGMEPREQRC